MTAVYFAANALALAFRLSARPLTFQVEPEVRRVRATDEKTLVPRACRSAPNPKPRTHTRTQSIRVRANPSSSRDRHACSNPRPLRALPTLLRTTRSAPTPSLPFVKTRQWCTRADPRRLRYASRLRAKPPSVPASRALTETGYARVYPLRAFALRVPPVVHPCDLAPPPSFAPRLD